MAQVLCALAAGSLSDSGTAALLLLLVGDMVTAVIGCAHGPPIVDFLITILLPSEFYVYLYLIRILFYTHMFEWSSGFLSWWLIN